MVLSMLGGETLSDPQNNSSIGACSIDSDCPFSASPSLGLFEKGRNRKEKGREWLTKRGRMKEPFSLGDAKEDTWQFPEEQSSQVAELPKSR